ncbi:hypothetical protein ACJ4V0_16030 [Phreatobacter sp. HK31-P]
MAPPSFQKRVGRWMNQCFGREVPRDRRERAHRFLEEALELAQVAGCTAHEASQLIAYVYSRPKGEKEQEVGGVMVTLAALCTALNVDQSKSAETELNRVWTKVAAIREKHASKPKLSPLPGVSPTAVGTP